MSKVLAVHSMSDGSVNCDEKSMDVFNYSQQQIESMSLIHAELYKSADLALVDFEGYVSILTENQFESYGVAVDGIALGIEVDASTLDIEKATPLRLIANELVSKPLKFNFSDSEKGFISVSLSQTSEDSMFVVADDGVGIAQELDIDAIQTLGL